MLDAIAQFRLAAVRDTPPRVHALVGNLGGKVRWSCEKGMGGGFEGDVLPFSLDVKVWRVGCGGW